MAQDEQGGDPVRITCYGGVDQIGGNQILLEDGDLRLFLDFGKPYSQWSRFYEEYLKPRPGLLDVLEVSLLPPLQGLYRQDLEQGPVGLWERYAWRPGFRRLPAEEVSGVLLSHAHLDHSGYISFLGTDIPIYATAMTCLVAKAVQDTGRSDFESEVVYAVPRELRADGALGVGASQRVSAQQRSFSVGDTDSLTAALSAFWEHPPGARRLSSRPLRAATAIRGARVQCFPVDHSIPGACAWAVETSAGWVAFTGDLRLPPGPKTEGLLERLERLHVAVLVCEGTRATAEQARPPVTERDVYRNALTQVKKAQGLVIADFGPRNLERLAVFHRIAQEMGRRLAVLPKDAYLLEAAALLDPGVPSMEADPSLCLYATQKVSRDRWEGELERRLSAKLVRAADVNAAPGDFILCFSLLELDELPSIHPGPGSLYLYSSHEPFNEEVGLNFRRLWNWVEHFGMRPVGLPKEVGPNRWEYDEEDRGFHASGHASGEELVGLIKAARPRVLVPVHAEPSAFSYYSEKLRDEPIEVRRPTYGVPVVEF